MSFDLKVYIAAVLEMMQQIAANATRVRACRDISSLILSADADSGARQIAFIENNEFYIYMLTSKGFCMEK